MNARQREGDVEHETRSHRHANGVKEITDHAREPHLCGVAQTHHAEAERTA
jgi:hypothetical protein